MIPLRCFNYAFVCLRLSEACKNLFSLVLNIKKGLFVKWGHVNTLLWMLSASQCCCQRHLEWIHTHIWKHALPLVCMCILDYVTALECHHMTKGEPTVLNELESDTKRSCFYPETAWVTMADWVSAHGVNREAFAAASLKHCFPRQGARLVFIVDTKAVWGR